MIDRPLYKDAWRQLSGFKSMVFLAGPRQAGKTTFAQALMADLSHVLAGRVGVVTLPPITWHEEQGATTRPLWIEALEGKPPETLEAPTCAFNWDRLVRGGYPISVTAGSDRHRALWMESFRQTYLERDLRRMRDIGHLTDFARLMELTASRTSQIMNQASLSREAGLNAATLGRYLSLLEASFLIKRLHPWHANIGKRLVKSPKCYWTDSGLACHLCGVSSAELPEHALTGPLFESFVIMEMQALLSQYIPDARLYYFRSHTGVEIDALIQRGQELFPVEIKASRTVAPDDALPIKRWREWTGQSTPGFVLYAGTEVKPLGHHIAALPI